MSFTKAVCCFLALTATTLSFGQDSIEFDVLNNLTAHQWVRTNEAGMMQGRLEKVVGSSTRRATLTKVAMIPLNGGSTTLRGKTGLDGIFSIEDIPVGTYGMVAHGNDLMAAYTVHVLPPSKLSDNRRIPTFQMVAMQPAAVSSGDLRAFASPVGTDYVMKSIRKYIPPETPAPYKVHRFLTDPIKNRVQGLREVYAASDGSLKGRLALPVGDDGRRRPMTGMNVLVFRGNESPVSTTVSEDGTFAIKTLSSGSYGLIAAGTSGVGSVGFEFINERTTLNYGANNHRYVSLQPRSQELSCEVVPSFALPQIEAELKDDDGDPSLADIGDPVPLNEFGWPQSMEGPGLGDGLGGGSGSTGPGSGGGGGGGGGDGIGAIIGAAGLAGLAGGGGSDNVASPASP